MSEASIAVKLKDEFTQGVDRMEDANKGFNVSLGETQKKAEHYAKRLSDLVDKQADLQVQLQKAKEHLNDVKKAFKEAGDAADDSKLKEANKNYNELAGKLANVSRAANDTRRALYSLDETGRKKSQSSSGGIMATLGTAGATAFAGELAAQTIGTLANSMGGEAIGNYVSSALSSASMGAAIGNTIAPGAGAAIGAALGGVGGLFSAALSEYGAKDDSYREQVQSQYDSLLSDQTSRLHTGSELAAQRETDTLAFERLLGEGIGAAYLEDVRRMGADTPMTYEGLTSMSRALATGFGKDPERMLQLMTGLGDAGSAVGIDEAGMTEMAKAMSRMESSGKATLEYLNIFQDRGVDVIGILSDGLGKTQAQIYDMISKGEIGGVEAVQMIQDALDDLYGGAMEQQSKTFSGLSSTLEDVNNELAAAMGDGYNNERKQGMEEQIAYLSGEMGDSMAEAYRLMGEFQASLENQQEELQRNAMETVMSGVLSGSWSEKATAQLTELMSQYDEAKAQDNGAEMGRVIAAAQAVAQAEYTNSEGYQTQVDANMQLVNDVQQAVSYSYYEAGYALGQELSKGVSAAIMASFPDTSAAAVSAAARTSASVSTYAAASQGILGNGTMGSSPYVYTYNTYADVAGHTHGQLAAYTHQELREEVLS